MVGERRAALERERVQSANRVEEHRRSSFVPLDRSALKHNHLRAHRSQAPKESLFSRHTFNRSALSASGATLALVSGLLFAPPASAEPLQTVVSIAAGRSSSQQLTVSSMVATAHLDVNDPVGAAIAGVIASEGAAAGTHAASEIVSDLSASGARQRIIATALSYLGDPYVFGGASHSGIDCSGLVMMAYESVGIQLAHLVSAQDAAGVTIPESEAQPGDLVVFNDDEHVAIYLGGGLLIQAPEEGEDVQIHVVWQGIPHHFVRILPS